MYHKVSFASLTTFTCQRPAASASPSRPKPEQPRLSTSTSASPDSAALIPSEQRMDSADKLFASHYLQGPRPVYRDPRDSAPVTYARREADPLGRAPASRRLEWARGRPHLVSERRLRTRCQTHTMPRRHSRAPFPAPAVDGPRVVSRLT